MSNTCRHCEKAIPETKPGAGRIRRFCSDTCRVKFAYRLRMGTTRNREALLRRIAAEGAPYEPPAMTDMEAIWLAAMIDAEGHICLHKDRRPDSIYYFANVGVSNTHDGIVNRVAEIIGPRWVKIRSRKTKPGFRLLKAAEIQRVALSDVLRQVRPFLIAKQRQAELLMEWAGIVDPLPVRTARPPRVQEIFLEMAVLNKRGLGAVGAIGRN